MATYAGIISTPLLFAPNSIDVLDATGRTNPAGFQQFFYSRDHRRGSHTEKTEINVNPASWSGNRQYTFLDDFYNRVHFRPSPFSFGAVATNVTRVLKVWNAHLVANNLNVVTIDPGINVTYGGASLPLLFKALEEKNLNFTAAQQGVPKFNEFTIFEFDLKAPYFVLFIGNRSVLIERGPNWRDAVVENISFNTEIVARSRSGREQRRALRQEPRRTISYTLSTWADSRRAAQGLLTRWRRRTLLTPIWPWRTTLSAVTLAGSATLNVNHVPNWAVSGMNVVIEHITLGGRINAIVDSTAPGQIILESGVAQELPVGTTVTQMMAARIRDGQTVDRITADVSEIPITYDIQPGVDPVYVPGAAPATYKGFEVALIDPNWRDAIQDTWEMPVDEIDAGWGVLVYFDFQDFAQYTMRVGFSGVRDDKVGELFDLFYRQRGQQGEFWFPTFSRDIEPGYQLDEAATVIRIVGQDFAADWADQSTNQAVIVWLTDGSYLIRSVVNISTTTDSFGTDSVITLDDTWPYDIPTNRIRKISWLMRARFATDTLRIEWLTDSKANVQFAVRTLEVL